MKTLTLPAFGLGLALTIAPFVAGCGPHSQSPPADTSKVVAPAQPAQPTIVDPAAGPAVPAPPPTDKPIPANINPSPALAEVIKLVRAGVDEGVMLAFVNGSQSAFNLESDDIIFLSDIGVPDEVMTAMMERDAVLKQVWSPPGHVATAAAETPRQPEVAPVAVAPTYVEEPQPLPEPQQVIVNNNYFYETLAPYGSWVNLSGYGWCWQPTVAVVNSNWRPYSDRGRWLYTSAGWYWNSDYSWGMTFQYGRWFNQPGYGWCWWPDRVWAPSWVTWRYNSSYCGWAPLPPATYYTTGIGLSYVNGSVGVGFGFGLSSDCYTFVGWNNFCSPNPYRYRVPYAQNAVIANNSTVINNYVNGDNNTIINHGVAPEQVAQYSGRQVPRTSLDDARARRGAGWLANRSEEVSRSGDARRGSTPAQSAVRSDSSRNVGIGNHADARGNNSGVRPAATSSGRQMQTPGGNNDDVQPRTTPPAQRDRRDYRDVTSPRPGIPEHNSRRSPLIVNGSDSSGSRGLAASTETAPPGSLILNGNPAENTAPKNGRYVPPTTSRNVADRQQRTSAFSQRSSSPTEARSAQPRTALPARATVWTPPAAQNTGVLTPPATSFRDSPSSQRSVQPVQSRPMVSSRPTSPSATMVAPRQSPQQFRSAPAPAASRPQVSAPSAPARRPSPTAVAQNTARVESRSVSSPQIQSSPRSMPSSGATRPGNSPGRSSWDNRAR
ncbi:MAG TPA: hypothetical protein PKA41_04370 [Verrucomicrobiota bacterium]|nr:hypothetical protein [Verrucomicrobiota bacterium]